MQSKAAVVAHIFAQHWSVKLMTTQFYWAVPLEGFSSQLLNTIISLKKWSFRGKTRRGGRGGEKKDSELHHLLQAKSSRLDLLYESPSQWPWCSLGHREQAKSQGSSSSTPLSQQIRGNSLKVFLGKVLVFCIPLNGGKSCSRHCLWNSYSWPRTSTSPIQMPWKVRYVKSQGFSLFKLIIWIPLQNKVVFSPPSTYMLLDKKYE